MRNYIAADVQAFAEGLRDKDGLIPVYDIRGTHTRWNYQDRPDPENEGAIITTCQPDPTSLTHDLKIKKIAVYEGHNAVLSYDRVAFEVGGGWQKRPNEKGVLEDHYVHGVKRVLFINEVTPLDGGSAIKTLCVDEDWIN